MSFKKAVGDALEALISLFPVEFFLERFSGGVEFIEDKFFFAKIGLHGCSQI
jgi:hypothetical protein